MKARPTADKRRKEKERQERAKEKAAMREQRKVEKGTREPRDPNEIDPDIADIVPGPQPLPSEFE